MSFIKRRIKIFAFPVIIVAISIAIYLLLNNLNCQRLNCLSLKSVNEFKVSKIYEDNKYTFRALYERDEVILRTEIKNNFSAAESEQVIRSRIARNKELFEDAQAPYPDEISDVISCSNEFKPIYSARKQNGIQISYFTGFVNDRLVFGSCVSDQAKYKDTLTMFYCAKQKKFYQLEIITPNKNSEINANEYRGILGSIGCKE